jgi:RNA polymerase sigma factor (TIGR02999 family)
MSDLSRVLAEIDRGDTAAADRLLLLVYEELRKLAAARLAHEKPGQTLQATALVHEVFVRLVAAPQQQQWHSRAHFFAAAAEAMRRILVENARRKSRRKHGGKMRRIDLDDCAVIDRTGSDDLLDLDAALTRLAAEDPDKARLVELRFFTGLSNKEAAEVLGVSEPTVKRHWRYARAWLRREIRGDE